MKEGRKVVATFPMGKVHACMGPWAHSSLDRTLGILVDILKHYKLYE